MRRMGAGGNVILARCEFHFLETIKMSCNIQVLIYPFLQFKYCEEQRHRKSTTDSTLVLVQIRMNKSHEHDILIFSESVRVILKSVLVLQLILYDQNRNEVTNVNVFSFIFPKQLLLTEITILFYTFQMLKAFLNKLK